MKSVLCISVLIFLIPGISFAKSGFLHGNLFKSQKMSATIILYCNRNDRRHIPQYYNCQSNQLTPQAQDYFVNPAHPDAKKVRLTNTRENGSIKIKTRKFDGPKGRTKKRVNLWSSGLFQKPLLEKGKNTIQYEILDKNKNIIEMGYFVVQVETRPNLYCSTRVFYDYHQLCNHPSYYCSQVFQEKYHCYNRPL